MEGDVEISENVAETIQADSIDDLVLDMENRQQRQLSLDKSLEDAKKARLEIEKQLLEAKDNQTSIAEMNSRLKDSFQTIKNNVKLMMERTETLEAQHSNLNQDIDKMKQMFSEERSARNFQIQIFEKQLLDMMEMCNKVHVQKSQSMKISETIPEEESKGEAEELGNEDINLLEFSSNSASGDKNVASAESTFNEEDLKDISGFVDSSIMSKPMDDLIADFGAKLIFPNSPQVENSSQSLNEEEEDSSAFHPSDMLEGSLNEEQNEADLGQFENLADEARDNFHQGLNGIAVGALNVFQQQVAQQFGRSIEADDGLGEEMDDEFPLEEEPKL